MSGFGKKIFTEESQFLNYIGDWENGYMWGKGRVLWKNGAKYVGDFYRGLKHGTGLLTYEKSSRFDYYNGSYFYDLRSGNGTLVWKNKDKFVGLFQNDTELGFGVFRNFNSILSGFWEGGGLNGNGTAIFKSGKKYVGFFVKSKLNGYAVIYNATISGFSKIQGIFKNNKANGNESVWFTNGSR